MQDTTAPAQGAGLSVSAPPTQTPSAEGQASAPTAAQGWGGDVSGEPKEPLTGEATEGEAGGDEAPSDPDEERRRSAAKVRRDRQKAFMARTQAELEQAKQRVMEADNRLLAIHQSMSRLTKPTPEEFHDSADYAVSATLYQVKLDEMQRARQAAERAAEDAKAGVAAITQEEQRALHLQWRETVQDASARYADFEAVALADFPVSRDMGEILINSSHGADVLYYLGMNPQRSAEIAVMPRERATYELGLIAGMLTRPQSRAVSNAPPPVRPTNAGGGRAAKSDLSTMSMEEYRAARGFSPIR